MGGYALLLVFFGLFAGRVNPLFFGQNIAVTFPLYAHAAEIGPGVLPVPCRAARRPASAAGRADSPARGARAAGRRLRAHPVPSGRRFHAAVFGKRRRRAVRLRPGRLLPLLVSRLRAHGADPRRARHGGEHDALGGRHPGDRPHPGYRHAVQRAVLDRRRLQRAHVLLPGTP